MLKATYSCSIALLISISAYSYSHELTNVEGRPLKLGCEAHLLRAIGAIAAPPPETAEVLDVLHGLPSTAAGEVGLPRVTGVNVFNTIIRLADPTESEGYTNTFFMTEFLLNKTSAVVAKSDHKAGENDWRRGDIIAIWETGGDHPTYDATTLRDASFYLGRGQILMKPSDTRRDPIQINNIFELFLKWNPDNQKDVNYRFTVHRVKI
jgi:hypothetical protein